MKKRFIEKSNHPIVLINKLKLNSAINHSTISNHKLLNVITYINFLGTLMLMHNSNRYNTQVGVHQMGHSFNLI